MQVRQALLLHLMLQRQAVEISSGVTPGDCAVDC